MYLAFFGLSRAPFSMTPDPSLIFPSDLHREAISGLTYAILERKGCAALTGRAGTGKTTVIAKMFQHFPPGKIVSSVILNPVLSPSEFLEMMLLDFGFTEIPDSNACRIVALQTHFVEVYRAEKIAVVVIDEAHKLSFETLEEVRLLGNFDNHLHKLLQVVLVGQPELDDFLNLHNLSQLKQRIAVRLRLDSLRIEEVRKYIEHRWFRAGGNERLPFTKEALAEIALYSRGIPRLINLLGDNARLTAFAESSGLVTRELVHEAVKDLDMRDSVRPDELDAAEAELADVLPPHAESADIFSGGHLVAAAAANGHHANGV